MKKSLLFLICCFSLFVSKAQNWALPSSKWLCNYSWMSPIYSFSIAVEKDTVIENINCKQIGHIEPLYTYEQNDTVYFYIGGHFHPTYYFSAHIGDTVSTYLNPIFCFTDTLLRAVVTRIDSVVLSNQILRSFHCNFVLDSAGLTINYPDTFVYTEKIGSNYIYPYFFYNCIVDPESYGTCDYGDSTITGFYVGLIQGCQTAITTLPSAAATFTIYPNPATNQLNISIDESLTGAQLNIYNVTGSLVQSAQLQIANSKFEIQNLPNGVYVAVVTTPKSPNGDFNTVMRRWVKM